MYYNTTNETGNDLKESHKKTKSSKQVSQHHHHK